MKKQLDGKIRVYWDSKTDDGKKIKSGDLLETIVAKLAAMYYNVINKLTTFTTLAQEVEDKQTEIEATQKEIESAQSDIEDTQDEIEDDIKEVNSLIEKADSLTQLEDFAESVEKAETAAEKAETAQEACETAESNIETTVNASIQNFSYRLTDAIKNSVGGIMGVLKVLQRDQLFPLMVNLYTDDISLVTDLPKESTFETEVIYQQSMGYMMVTGYGAHGTANGGTFYYATGVVRLTDDNGREWIKWVKDSGSTTPTQSDWVQCNCTNLISEDAIL